MAALRRNLHLFIFSDNVPIADEIAMKQEALRRGLLCMGPDQGTAYLGGVGLGFANVVARGRVGCVAASGTGLQAVVSRLDALGEGVSHAIGVGGRDLSEAVGGAMTLFALDALAADPATEGIVLVSKPPHPSVLDRVEARLAAIPKPTVICCVGAKPRSPGKVVWVDTLQQAADAIVAAMAGQRWDSAPLSDAGQVGKCLRSLAGAGCGGRRILGLYTGGTLAYETGHVLRGVFGDDHPHRILDLGDDEYTVGRPHPMIDPRTRGEMIVRAGADPRDRRAARRPRAGQGRSRKPRGAPGRGGERGAPERTVGRARHRRARCGDRHGGRPAGPRVAGGPAGGGGHRDARDECRCRAVRGHAGPPAVASRVDAGDGVMETKVLPEALRVINVGLESFADDLRADGVPVVQLDWRPPAGGNARLAALLAELDDEE